MIVIVLNCWPHNMMANMYKEDKDMKQDEHFPG